MKTEKKNYGRYIADGHSRKEIDLHNEVIVKLQSLADKKGWKLKPYMEYVLTQKSNIVKNK